MGYEYGRIGKLAESLAAHGVAECVAARIMAGGEDIRRADKPNRKAAWMAGAMERMDSLLDLPTRQCVREACACCLGGEREKAVKRIARSGGALADRIRAANETRLVFGNSVELQPDDSIVVRFQPEGQPGYRCACLGAVKEPMSLTYCFCCGGHVKHHLRIALGQEVEGTVRTSALASGGKQPCTFAFTVRP